MWVCGGGCVVCVWGEYVWVGVWGWMCSCVCVWWGGVCVGVDVWVWVCEGGCVVCVWGEYV